MRSTLKTIQSAALSQKQILSARILAMDSAELNEYLTELMEENPVLNIDSMLESMQSGSLSWIGVYGRRRNDSSGESTIFDTLGRYDTGLRQSLRLQLDGRPYNALELSALNYMIECVDDDGYMKESLDYIEELFCLMPGRGLELLRVIQAMSPCGVGARDVRECILIQLLDRYPEEALAFKIAASYLDALAANRIGYIAKKLGAGISDTVKAVQIIKSLSPRPCAELYDESICAVIPDVIVAWKDGRYQAIVNAQSLPRISVCEEYRSLAESTGDNTTRNYINEKYKQADWVASCIAQRGATLRGIAEQILASQRAFFHIGPQALCALTQKQIAEALDIHESTVSRALKNKYLLCRWGVFPMKYFFSENLISGASASSGLHAVLLELIANEDKHAPLTDQELANRISSMGTKISRRTVAKYREELNILPSAKRKAF